MSIQGWQVATVACLLGLAAAVPSPAANEAVENPPWLALIGPSQPGKHPSLPAGTLAFEVSWKGILRSGEVEMSFGEKGAHKPDTTVIRSKAISRGVASVIFPYHGSSWTEINPSSLRPRLFRAFERNKEETIDTRSDFLNDRVICRETTREHGNKPPSVETQTFPYTPIHSIESAILHLRSQPLADGDECHLLLHPFNHPYLLKARVLGREKHHGNEAIKLSLEMHKIDRKKLTLKAYRKLKGPATLWLSDDTLRVPLEIRAKIFVGDIRATLKEFRKS